MGPKKVFELCSSKLVNELTKFVSHNLQSVLRVVPEVHHGYRTVYISFSFNTVTKKLVCWLYDAKYSKSHASESWETLFWKVHMYPRDLKELNADEMSCR
jgi:hypothetical protein